MPKFREATSEDVFMLPRHRNAQEVLTQKLGEYEVSAISAVHICGALEESIDRVKDEIEENMSQDAEDESYIRALKSDKLAAAKKVLNLAGVSLEVTEPISMQNGQLGRWSGKPVWNGLSHEYGSKYGNVFECWDGQPAEEYMTLSQTPSDASSRGSRTPQPSFHASDQPLLTLPMAFDPTQYQYQYQYPLSHVPPFSHYPSHPDQVTFDPSSSEPPYNNPESSRWWPTPGQFPQR